MNQAYNDYMIYILAYIITHLGLLFIIYFIPPYDLKP